MSADRLRKAAALMRERAEKATPGPWERGEIGHFSNGRYHLTYADVEPNVAGGVYLPDADHIASWHPAVALAVADWLERVAFLLEHGSTSPGEPSSALAVADAYLGGES